MRFTPRRVARFAAALSIIGISISFLAGSDLGADPITVLYMGLKAAFGLSFGLSSFLYNGTVIGLAVLFAWRHVGPGTLAYSFMIGFFIAMGETLFARFDLRPDGVVGQIMFLAVGQLMLSFGISLVIKLDLGVNCLDALILMLRDRYGIPYKFLRVSFDALITGAGFAMGGVVGIGTLVSVLSRGFLIQYFSGTLKRFGI